MIGLKKGFTLIELLVVIAIIAILAVVVVLSLNPSELLKQSRDSNRLSDLDTLNRAIALYLTDQSGASSFFLGSSTVTYLSMVDPTATTTAGTDCSGIGFPAGGSFHCPASTTVRNVNGTGWIPINFAKITSGAPLGSLPIDPVNTSSTDLYYSYTTDGANGYRIIGVPESQKYTSQTGANNGAFQEGNSLYLNGGQLVLVPGNTSLGTPNFWVMKYEPACTKNGVILSSPLDGNGYEDNFSVATNCKIANGFLLAALPNANPVVDISATSAQTYCTSIGEHLLKNIEWQTIAWDAESVGTNWSGGSVGSGTMYSGHNDNQPASALVADGNDGNGYAGETNVGGSQKRTDTLSNGSVIWDMDGNLWAWLQDTIVGTNEPNAGAGGQNWNEFTALTNLGTLTQPAIGASNSTWNSSQGIGEIFSEGQTDGTTYTYVRGGYWHTGLPHAGIEALNLSFNNSGFATSTVSFRCAR